MKKQIFFVLMCVAVFASCNRVGDFNRRESMAEIANKALNLTLDPSAAREWGGDIPVDDLSALESITWRVAVMAGVDYSAGKAGTTKDGKRYCIKQEAASQEGEVTISFLRYVGGVESDSLSWERVGYLTNNYSDHHH